MQINKNLIGYLVGLVLLVSNISMVYAGLARPDSDNFPYETPAGNSSGYIGNTMKVIVMENESILAKLRTALKLEDYGDDKPALAFAQQVIDYFLYIVLTVALLVLIYGFYLILIPGKTEESLKKARQYIVGAIISLFVMGVSWYIVSWFFYIFSGAKPT